MYRYDAEGFFVNEVAVDSAIVCTGTIWMIWDVKTFDDITEDSLALPLLLRPPPGRLLIAAAPMHALIHLGGPMLQRQLCRRCGDAPVDKGC